MYVKVYASVLDRSSHVDVTSPSISISTFRAHRRLNRKNDTMFTFVTFATLVLALTRVTSGYEELIGLPEEVFGESDHLVDLWDLQDNDIWNENHKSTKQEPKNSRSLLQKLCEDYDFAIDDKIIDCKSLRLVEKSLKVPAEHLLSKREVEPEAPLGEGSGDGEEHPAAERYQESGDKTVPETSSEHIEHEHVATEHSEPSEHLNNYQSANVVDVHAPDAENGAHSGHVQKNAELVELKTEEKTEEKSTEQTLRQQESEQQSAAEQTAPKSEILETPKDPKKLIETVGKTPEEESKAEERPLGGITTVSSVPVEQQTTEQKATTEHAEVKPEEKTSRVTLGGNEAAVSTSPHPPKEEISEKPAEQSPEVDQKPETKITADTKGQPTSESVAPKDETTEKPAEHNPEVDQKRETTITADTKVQPTPESVAPKNENTQKPAEQKPELDQKPETTVTADTKVQPKSESVAPKESQDKKEQNKGDKPDATEDKDSKTAAGETKEQSSSEGIIKTGRKSSENADESANETETNPAAVGEAKESVSQKDTKILLGLFGAVVGMGAAAFGYYQIRKRKRANATRKSHNGVNKDDSEEGKEMKPLIANGENKKATVVDFESER